MAESTVQVLIYSLNVHNLFTAVIKPTNILQPPLFFFSISLSYDNAMPQILKQII